MKKIAAGLAAVLVFGALSFSTAEASENVATADLGTLENAQELSQSIGDLYPELANFKFD